MGDKKLRQEPAFPITEEQMDRIERYPDYLKMAGLSREEYAAIHLKVPNSGHDWLDEMIRKANHHDSACAAMQGLISNPYWASVNTKGIDPSELVKKSLEVADELLKQEFNNEN